MDEVAGNSSCIIKLSLSYVYCNLEVTKLVSFWYVPVYLWKQKLSSRLLQSQADETSNTKVVPFYDCKVQAFAFILYLLFYFMMFFLWCQQILIFMGKLTNTCQSHTIPISVPSFFYYPTTQQRPRFDLATPSFSFLSFYRFFHPLRKSGWTHHNDTIMTHQKMDPPIFWWVINVSHIYCTDDRVLVVSTSWDPQMLVLSLIDFVHVTWMFVNLLVSLPESIEIENRLPKLASAYNSSLPSQG